MIVFDASVLIAYLDRDDAHHETAAALLEREADDDFSASPVTLAEVLVGPARAGRITDAVAVLADLEVTEQAFPSGTAVELATLRAGSGLRMPDCCVLLAARDGDARLASFDAPLTRAAANLGIETLAS